MAKQRKLQRMKTMNQTISEKVVAFQRESWQQSSGREQMKEWRMLSNNTT